MVGANIAQVEGSWTIDVTRDGGEGRRMCRVMQGGSREGVRQIMRIEGMRGGVGGEMVGEVAKPSNIP